MAEHAAIDNVKDNHNKFVLALIGLCLLLQLHLQFVQEINWDEFFYLSRIYEYQRGELAQPMQNFHVHLLGWLTHLPGSEISQINIGRTIMWGFQITIMGSIYVIARLFTSPSASALAVLAYVTSIFTLIHGTSFRTDPMAAGFTMIALAVLFRAKLSFINLAVFVLCLSLAALVTIKVVFFAPAFIGAVLWRYTQVDNRRFLLIKLGVSFMALLGVTAGLFIWHQNTMAVSSINAAQSGLSSAFKTTILSSELFPRKAFIVGGAKQSLIQAALLILGFAIAIAAIFNSKSHSLRYIVILLCAAPLLSLVFYRNAFPYFMPFIFPPAMILVAVALARFKLSEVAVAILAVVMSGMMGLQYANRLNDSQQVQRQTLAAVHNLFPDGVNYLDRCGMISSQRKYGFFMSSWGLKNYHKRNENEISDLIDSSIIPLVISNGPSLSHALNGDVVPLGMQFTSTDQFALQDNYLNYWGAIWIAGKSFEAGQRGTFIIRIPGKYTITSQSNVFINGVYHEPGSQISFDRGIHNFATTQAHGFQLLWGKTLSLPKNDDAPKSVFQGF